MSKADKRAAAAAAAVLKQAALDEGIPPQGVAAIDLFADMLDSLERIAVALEKMAAKPPGTLAVQGTFG